MKTNPSPLTPAVRRRLVLSAVWITMTIVAVLAVLRVVLTDSERLPIPALIVVASCLGTVLYIKTGGSIDVAARAFIGILLVGLAYGGFNVYGYAGSILLLAPLIPILAVLFLSVRASVVAFVLTVAILLGLLVLETRGLVPANPNSPELVALGRFFVLAAICLASSWSIWLFASHTRRLLSDIEKLSTTDHLTGVLNRRGVEDMLAHEIARARRNDTWLSLLMMDVDFFKTYNDNNGHQAGDRCLVRITEIIESCVSRHTDLLGRYGGEEFLLIFSDTHVDGAFKIAERIRCEILNQNIHYGPDDERPVTLTLGVVGGKGRHLTTVGKMIQYADRALYQGKRGGRNRTVKLCIDGVEREAPVSQKEAF